jgi:ferric-chelate reductase (NADPH)
MRMSKHKKHKPVENDGKQNKKKLRSARILAVERVGERYRLIDMLAKGCRALKWRPGMKIKIDTGDGETRTYTPIEIDGESGRLRILAYIHGDSPASQWALALAAGDKTWTAVPSSSLSFDSLRAPVIFFGDETSFGSAKALQIHIGSNCSTKYVFEVRRPEEARAVIARLALTNAELVQVQKDQSHLCDVVRQLRNAMVDLSTHCLVLTGNGLSIQAIRSALRASGDSEIDFVVKAYWTPKKALKD